MRTLYLQTLIFLGILFSGVDVSYAQPLVAGAESIETTVINSDLVFVAKLIRIGEVKQVNGREVYNTSIEIEKTLKQDVNQEEPYTKLQMEFPRSMSILKEWKDKSTRLLVAYDENDPDFTTVIELVPGKVEIFKADFTLLREPEDVIRAAEDALQRMPAAIKRVHTVLLYVPPEVVAKTKWGKYHGLRLNVPVDDQLEQRALRYIQSDNYMRRLEGVQALRYFQSEENIERVKALLEDATWSHFQHPQENDGVGVRYFGVRKEAYQTLKSWGEDVEKPVLKEEYREPLK